MSERDQLDRMERKLNRIGTIVLASIALCAVLLAAQLEPLSDGLLANYSRPALGAFILIVGCALFLARIPFRP